MRIPIEAKPGRVIVSCLGIAAIAFCSAWSFAQVPGGGGGVGGPGGARLSPEDLAKVWTIEAKAVAKQLGLADDLSGKLVDAYKAARESQMSAVRAKMTGGGERGPGNWAAMREVTDAERGKFETALKGFLKEDQTATALTTLGTFSRRWDAMALVLDELKLDEAKGAEAMKLVMAFVVDSDKLMKEAMGGGAAVDREAMRTKSQALKQALDEGMGKVLTPEQLKTWTEKTTMRGGGGRRGEGPAPVPGAAPAPK